LRARRAGEDDRLVDREASAGYTRRTLLGRGGALAGALSLAGGGALAAHAAASDGGLTPERRANYIALIATLSAVSPTLDPARANEAADALAARYAGLSSSSRRAIDTALDSLDDSRSGDFSKSSAPARATAMKRRCGGHGGGAAGALATDAIALAVQPFAFDPRAVCPSTYSLALVAS
jgi:hypothetical protein